MRERKGRCKLKQGKPVGIVVGLTKLPGSSTDTFDDSNHEDAMTTRSPTSSADQLSALRLVTTALLLLLATHACSGAYYGKLIGKLSEFHHGVSGEVYAVDGRTLFIKDFTYDGEGPAAYFYVGTSKNVNGNGIRVRDEDGTTNVLKRYRKKDITLTLPEGKTLNNIKWFSVWCDEFSVNFGDVKIPRGFDYPKPQKLQSLSGIHGVSSEPVVIVDAQTLLIPSFSYDGEAPDAKFWVGSGATPSPQGIRVPDENGKVEPLRRYDRKTIVLTLPGDLTVHQLGHFGVWCEAFAVDFGHVQIPQNLNVPPSLKMLGVSPQSKLNCEVLEDNLAFEVRWAVAGDSIVVQLVAKLDAGQYMSFGLSPNPERSVMVGGDVVVAWVDKETLQGYAIDYFLDAKSQCSGGRGSCPDTRIQEHTNSIRLLNAALVNGYSIVTYQRPLKASDELDRQILTNGSQAIIWAIGPLNQRNEVSFHSHYLRTDRFIEFGRPPAWNCPMPDEEQPRPSADNDERESNSQALVATTRRPQRVPATPAPAPKTDAWDIPPIQCYEPEDGVFYAQMGPTGGKHGYPAITGHVGWGIAWYINGLLIPEINVVRGKKYTFVVEGGQDPETPARYHPFYITDDPVGGYQHKTPEERAEVKIFAGVRRQRGTVRPTGVGRLCNWVPDQNQPLADEFTSFGAYQRTLTLECDHGEPGIVEWTPDENTPDTVYYQCFTHRYLGWKINVHDSCDVTEGSASEAQAVYALPDSKNPLVDLENSGSVDVTSKVKPTAEFLQQHLHHPHREYGLRDPHTAATNPSKPGKLSSPMHHQLLTNANNNINNNNDHHYLRLQSPYEGSPYSQHRGSYSMSPGYNDVLPHRHEVSVKDMMHHAHLDEETLLRQHPKQQQQTHGSMAPTRPAATYLVRSPITGVELNETHQLRQQQHHPSNQELYNLVADPRPLNHGHRYAYPLPGTQHLISRVPHHHPHHHHPNAHYHHHHHHASQLEEPRTQFMIIRRPVLTRRPMLQANYPLMSSEASMPMQARPIFIERKKAVYRSQPFTSYKGTPDKQQYGTGTPTLTKMMRLDPKQRLKLEAKVSEAGPVIENLLGSLKPARNTGFNPDSIVIEGGFKPIIRDEEDQEDVIEKRVFKEHQDEGKLQKKDQAYQKQGNFDYRSIDTFEPVFKPSPAVSATSERGKKQKKKTSTLNIVNRNSKPRLDELDDMEMAADRIQASYLPPSTNRKPAIASESPSGGVLVTYDGKRLTDSGLARSITRVEEHDKDRLTSDILSRTPQFGRFKGELPPPIPTNVRVDNAPQLENHNSPSENIDLPDALSNTQKHTKLSLVPRTRRSPHEDHKMSSISFENGASITKESKQDHQHDHEQKPDDHDDHEDITLASAGQAILANIQYIVLTIILYYVI